MTVLWMISVKYFIFYMHLLRSLWNLINHEFLSYYISTLAIILKAIKYFRQTDHFEQGEFDAERFVMKVLDKFFFLVLLCWSLSYLGVEQILLLFSFKKRRLLKSDKNSPIFFAIFETLITKSFWIRFWIFCVVSWTLRKVIRLPYVNYNKTQTRRGSPVDKRPSTN